MSRSSSKGGGARTPLPLDFFEDKLNNDLLSIEEQRKLLNRNRLLNDNYDLLLETNAKLKRENELLEAAAMNLENEFEEGKTKLSDEQISELEKALKQLKNLPLKKDENKRPELLKKKDLRDYFKSEDQPGFYTAFQSRRNSFSEDDINS